MEERLGEVTARSRFGGWEMDAIAGKEGHGIQKGFSSCLYEKIFYDGFFRFGSNGCF